MTDMIERAAKASFSTEHGSDGCVWERSTEDSKGYWRDSARAALLAALDPEDIDMHEYVGEALVEEYQRMMKEDGGWNSGGLMRVVIKAMRDLAGRSDGTQGEPNP